MLAVQCQLHLCHLCRVHMCGIGMSEQSALQNQTWSKDATRGSWPY